MANRQTTFLLKRSNVPGKIPSSSGLTLGELALNTADAILYTSGTTANNILPIGWDRIHRTGDTVTGVFVFKGGTGSNTDKNIIIENNSGTETAYIRADGFISGSSLNAPNLIISGGTQSIFSGNSSSNLVRITQTGSGNAFVVEDDTNPDNTQFVITSDGKVGIGLTTPTQRLLVRENTSGETRIDVSNQSTASGVSTSAYFLAGTTGNRYMAMGAYGPNATGTYIGFNRSGIGVFEAGADTTAMIFNAANPSGAPIVFGQASTERMRIGSTGNVGIGTTTPREKLDVSGNTIISSGLTATTISATTISGGTMVITTLPTSGYTSTQILMRNSTSGQVEITNSTSPSIYNYGMTYAMSTFNYLT